MKTKEAPINPELPIDLTIQPDWQDTPFTISQLDYDTAVALQADYEAQAEVVPVTQNKAPQTVSEPQLAYSDFSTLPRLQTLRMKATAWFYDRQHDTNMYGLLLDRINDDRNVRFAREMGLIGVTHCAKHEKAVAALRRMF